MDSRTLEWLQNDFREWEYDFLCFASVSLLCWIHKKQHRKLRKKKQNWNNASENNDSDDIRKWEMKSPAREIVVRV